MSLRVLRRPSSRLHLRRWSDSRWQKRISGPLLDRIDIHLDVPRIPHEQLSDRHPGEPSGANQERVQRARKI